MTCAMQSDWSTEVLRHHYEATRKQKDLIPYLAIIHVRDMLIQPSERYELCTLNFAPRL